MKFPYGISDFNAIITEGYYYCDRTDRIPMLEDTGKYLLFIRPRRFGKSLLLSMLRHYYDIAGKDRFDKLFGHLKIGKNPTSLHSKYFILDWDFSYVDPTGSIKNIKQALFNHVNDRIKNFRAWYSDYLDMEIEINPDDALSSLSSLITAIQKLPYPLYLLIDEYDNFANEVMTGIQNEQDVYKALVHDKGPLKTLFKAVKFHAGKGGIKRIFITGVSPVVMSDITSGFNIAKNIYLMPAFNDLCGFTEDEVSNMIKSVADECGIDYEEALDMMRTYYNGYTFVPGLTQKLFNPTLALYFAEWLKSECKFPRKMLDANLATDEAKLEYITNLPRGPQMLLDITRETEQITISDISDRFGIRDMVSDETKDYEFLISFLYYFGVLTIDGQTFEGELIMKVPNLVMRGLYINKLRQMLLPEPGERDDGRFAAKKLYAKGNIEPLCKFIEERYFKVFHNPDYKWANELTIKTAFLMLLYNDILYIMDSERETGRGYADLTMIIRPDMRKFQIYDVLLEFKYVKLKDAGLTGDEAKKLSYEDLQKIPAMIKKMEQAKAQGKKYAKELNQKHKDLRLITFAVVALGFERLWWEEI